MPDTDILNVNIQRTKIKIFVYLAGCTMLPHLPAPFQQLHNLLPPFASVVPVFFH
jgi:hypothetical protein